MTKFYIKRTLTVSGEDHLHRDEGQFATFKNGVLKFMPHHNDNGSYTVKVVTTDLSGNESEQEFNLLVNLNMQEMIY